MTNCQIICLIFLYLVIGVFTCMFTEEYTKGKELFAVIFWPIVIIAVIVRQAISFFIGMFK
jgi:hypothetical protein